MVSTTEIMATGCLGLAVFISNRALYSIILIAIQLRGEEVADIQAMFNATKPWLLLIKDKTSNFLSAISFN